MKSYLRLLMCALVSFACAGCGDVGAGVDVSGMVTQNGQPIEHATISFTPSKETKGPKAGSAIKDGWYRIEADQGLRQGQYVVTVSLTTAPSRRQVMVEKSKWSQKSYDFQRAITGENAQIDIDL